MNYRRPIISVLGHVDHGKTELLDTVRDSNSKDYESGSITQHVKAANMPIDAVGNLGISVSDNVQIPGFVWIDTPGHGAFSTARRQGGQFSDISVLVVDATSGIQPQTKESIQILKKNETPFVVALNKIDKLPGWKGSINSSSNRFNKELNNTTYRLAGDLHEFGINANLYNEISNFRKNVAIIPISAKENFGVDNLAKVIIGLTQEYLTDKIRVTESNSTHAVVLDKTTKKGFGEVANTLLSEGILHSGDSLYIGGSNEKERVVKSILKPNEKHDSTDRSFRKIHEASAAMFIRIKLDSLDKVEPGDVLTDQQKKQTNNIYTTETKENGVVVCSDTTGSSSAIVNQLANSNAPVSSVEVGDINKYNVTKASSMSDPENRVVIGFNVGVTNKARELSQEENVKIITDSVIHNIEEKYEQYCNDIRNQNKQNLTRPGELKVLENFVFNRSNPAIVGIKVIRGKVEKNCPVVVSMNKYHESGIGEVNQIKVDGEDVESVSEGDKASIEISGATVSRDFNTGDTLLTKVPESDIKQLSHELDDIDKNTRELIEDIKDSQQEREPFWGI